jgi:hypothetical protein
MRVRVWTQMLSLKCIGIAQLPGGSVAAADKYVTTAWQIPVGG